MVLKGKGSVTFRLPEYRKKKESKEVFQSPSFYTHPNGYHMALRVYANGCGDGEGTHVSVFARVLKGEYDAGLKWPFIGSVIFTLLNQIKDNKHETVTAPFTAKSDRRIGDEWGFHDFIPHSALAHDPVKVTSGVPQGSILGPLLFLLSVNSVFDISISRNAVLSMYEDDIVIYKTILCKEDAISFQSDVCLVVDWIESNQLRLNSQKMKFMLISRKRQPPIITISINGIPIQQVASFRYLGVILSQDLSWGHHINQMCLKAKNSLDISTGVLGKLSPSASRTCSRYWSCLCSPTAPQFGIPISVVE